MALTMDFTGKHVFAFGGTTDIGFAIAENFTKHGANVSIASRNQQNVDAATAALGTAGATSSASPPTSVTPTPSEKPSTARPANSAPSTADKWPYTAPCVVPWANGEIDDWLAAVDPVRIGPAPAAPAVVFTITRDIKVSDVVTVRDLLVPFVYEVADLSGQELGSSTAEA
jgi:hypothetical protein